MSTSLQVKMARNDWTEEEAEYFIYQQPKRKNIKTIFDSKQHQNADFLQQMFHLKVGLRFQGTCKLIINELKTQQSFILPT